MKWKNLTAKDLDRLVNKLSLEPGGGKRSKHPVYWYRVKGKRTLRITLPNIHGGESSRVSLGFLKAICNDLRVKTHQLESLVECSLPAEDYEHIIEQLFLPR